MFVIISIFFFESHQPIYPQHSFPAHQLVSYELVSANCFDFFPKLKLFRKCICFQKMGSEVPSRWIVAWWVTAIMVKDLAKTVFKSRSSWLLFLRAASGWRSVQPFLNLVWLTFHTTWLILCIFIFIALLLKFTFEFLKKENPSQIFKWWIFGQNLR